MEEKKDNILKMPDPGSPEYYDRVKHGRSIRMEQRQAVPIRKINPNVFDSQKLDQENYIKYENILKKKPMDTETRLKFVQTCQRLNRYQEAIANYELYLIDTTSRRDERDWQMVMENITFCEKEMSK